MRITITVDMVNQDTVNKIIQAIREITDQEVNTRIVDSPTLPFSTEM